MISARPIPAMFAPRPRRAPWPASGIELPSERTRVPAQPHRAANRQQQNDGQRARVPPAARAIGCEKSHRFRRAKHDDHVEEGQPAEAPAKDIGRRQHRKEEHDREQTEFPLNSPNESTRARDQSEQQEHWRDQAASQFRCAVRDGTREKSAQFTVHAGRINPGNAAGGTSHWKCAELSCASRAEPLK